MTLSFDPDALAPDARQVIDGAAESVLIAREGDAA
jgi:hypothetical protein